MARNKIVHWELMGADGDTQRNFYSSIFDWSFQTPEGFDDYHMVADDAVGVGGAVGKGNENMPTYQTIYVEVDSIEETLGKVEANGGATVLPRTVVPDMVTFALFNDPSGNLVGIVEGDS